MRSLILTLAVVAIATTLDAAASLSAQSIDPGLNREQVMARLGPVVAERNVGARTYLFYRNGCEQECGTHDIVVLENGVVVDAIFRASYRRYTGKSSSPVGLAARGDSTPAPVAPPPKGGFASGASIYVVPTTPPGITRDTTSVASQTEAQSDSTTKTAPVSEQPVPRARPDSIGAKPKAPADTVKRKP
jgi:hypothetical protein